MPRKPTGSRTSCTVKSGLYGPRQQDAMLRRLNRRLPNCLRRRAKRWPCGSIRSCRRSRIPETCATRSRRTKHAKPSSRGVRLAAGWRLAAIGHPADDREPGSRFCGRRTSESTRTFGLPIVISSCGCKSHGRRRRGLCRRSLLLTNGPARLHALPKLHSRASSGSLLTWVAKSPFRIFFETA